MRVYADLFDDDETGFPIISLISMIFALFFTIPPP
jgi:hypothetical protein